MTEERLRVLLRNAIELLEIRVFDNYETEAMDNLGMSEDEYCDVMCCDYCDDEEEGNDEERPIKQNEMYFDGYGYFKVNTDNYDEAVNKLIESLADAGIDFTIDNMELRNSEGFCIEC